MKKIICFTLALICILSGLFGCNSSKGAPLSTDGGASASASKMTEVYESETLKSEMKPVSESETSAGDPIPYDPESDAPERETVPAATDVEEIDTLPTYTCTLSIECTSVFENIDRLSEETLAILPKNGIIFAPQTVTFYEGESVYDVLSRVCRENRIHMEASFTPMYSSSYLEGIGNLYEFDCGSGSGWMYCVDGLYPNYGCSRYKLKQGQKIEWRYTCDLGNDIGGGEAAGG